MKICIGGELLGNGEKTPGCPLFPSKVKREAAEKTEKRLDAILDKALSLRQERDSGFEFYPENQLASVARVILMLDAQTKVFQRDLEIKTFEQLKLISERPGL